VAGLGPAIHVFGANIVTASRRGCPGRAWARGFWDGKLEQKRLHELPSELPRTALRFRGNDEKEGQLNSFLVGLLERSHKVWPESGGLRLPSNLIRGPICMV
jgi:hypothetical protein